MKKQFQKMVSFAAMLAVAVLPLTSCSDDSESNSSKPHTFTQTESGGYIEIEGEISQEVILYGADGQYLITGPIIVHEGGSIAFVPTSGTPMTVEAEPEFASYILVAQGGKMYVEGQSDSYVKFTTKDGSAAADRWGGLIVNGYAPISGANSNLSKNTFTTEINTAYYYGGGNVYDNSGVFRYMWLDKTGALSNSTSVEHNGLTLNGVGRGTVIVNIYITEANDDAIEFFGGSVNVKNLLAVNCDDDMFDFTQGYSGTLTNCYGIWESSFSSVESDPSGVEADGNHDGNGPTFYNQSNFTIENMTIDNRSTAGDMDYAIRVRRGATATITNALVKSATGGIGTLIDVAGSSNTTENPNQMANTNTSMSVSYAAGNITNIIRGYDFTGANYADATTGNITIDATPSNSGCESSIFSWTNYSF